MDTKEREENKKPGGYKKYVFLVILAGVIVFSFWLRGGSNTNTGVAALNNATETVSDEAVQAEIEKALSLVSRHIILPQNETPVMASIVNAEELIAEQPFYSNTVNGDILLIYSENRRAILYSPERDILVNVGPINIGDQTGE